MGGEVVLAGEPADVADLAEERGRQHRPHAEQLDQAGVGLGNRGLDARLDGGDALLQMTHIGDQVSRQLPADDRRLEQCCSGKNGVAGLAERRPARGGTLGAVPPNMRCQTLPP